jgi:hypothetical protein
MIEYVVNIRAKLDVHALRKTEILMDSQVYAPSPRAPEHVSLSYTRLRENVGTDRWKSERSGIPDLVSGFLIEVIAEHNGTEGRFCIKITDGVN